MAFIEQSAVTVFHENGRAYPQDIGQWDDTPETWDNWDTWFLNPIPELNILMPQQFDLGQIETFNVITNFQGQGLVDFYIYYSNSDTFTNSPLNYSTLEITAGDTDIPSITARYFWIAVSIAKQGNEIIQYFDNLNVTVSSEETYLTYTNVNSSTLDGTAANRLFPIPTTVGGVKSVQITSQGTTSNYDVDLYVSNIAIATKTYPRVLTKSTSGVNLQFVGIDGQSYDSVFDIELTVTPEWYADLFGNLQER
jgi:hypothetical protein